MAALTAAACQPDRLAAARIYRDLGFSVVPLRGKRPIVKWRPLTRQAASQGQLEAWASAGYLHNLGIICGAVSRNLVVLDLDGNDAFAAFKQAFPDLSQSYTVATGSGCGYHLYFFVESLPRSVRALKTPLGNIELRGEGCLAAAPPSLHPETGAAYTIHRPAPIQRLADLDRLAAWIQSLRQPRAHTRLNPRVVDHIARQLRRLGYRANGPWLNGPCIYPDRHQHGDAHHSFGYNTTTGYGNCFCCGSILTIDLVRHFGIDTHRLGGLTASERRPFKQK